MKELNKRECLCGCGSILKSKLNSNTRKQVSYIHGHNVKGKKMKYSKEGMERKRESAKKLLHWHKNNKEKSKEIMERNWNNTVRKWKGKNHPLYGKEVNPDRADKIRATIRMRYGKLEAWNKGKKFSKETNLKHSETNKRLYREGKLKLNSGCFKKGHKIWQNKSYREKAMKKILAKYSNRPTGYESKIINICLENKFPFVYTGDGSFLIGFKNPDFICEKHKKIIEVYCDYYKIRDFGNIYNYETRRRDYFLNRGYKTLFLSNKDFLRKDWRTHCSQMIRKFLLKGGSLEICNQIKVPR